MAYGNTPAGKAKPSVYKYGPASTAGEMANAKDKMKGSKKPVKKAVKK